MCRRKVVEAAAQRAQATAEWLETHEFMPQAELSSWFDVVSPLPAAQRILAQGPSPSSPLRMLHGPGRAQTLGPDVLIWLFIWLVGLVW